MKRAILDYNMIQDGDRILIAISGGADSFSLLKLLSGSQIVVTYSISILAVHLDMGFDGASQSQDKILRDYLQGNGYQFHIESTQIGRIAQSPANRKNPCFLCSRLRRKRLYEIAWERGCNKIAFGHHKDDIIETFFLNLLFSRELSTMVPNQKVFQGLFRIIRPLTYIEERLLKNFAQECDFPILENNCPVAKKSQRTFVKGLLAEFDLEDRRIKKNIFKSLRNVKREFLL
jgi:tRNA 2-thiocytidine biosynthesis protein TtcA